MSQETETKLERSDFKRIDKFFQNIDFLVPDYDKSCQYMVSMHETFYEWARVWVKGKRVLDAGCGEGYGVAILAETASEVVGIDLKQELIHHARLRYPEKNRHFLVMDCEKMSFEPGSFDVVVCNEMLEHLPDYRAFLNGAHSLLRPGGLFICATTNAELSFAKKDGTPMNRNHFQEFTPETFRLEMEVYYPTMRLFGEHMGSSSSAYIRDKKARGIEWLLVKAGIKHKIPIRWRNWVRERITGVQVDKVIQEGFSIVEDSLSNSLYLIACCEKK